VEMIVRALNIFGVVALVALAFYVGWALVQGSGETSPELALPAAATQAPP